MTDIYTVTMFDVCAEGYERFRHADEFILVGSVTRRTSRKSLTEQFISDIQTCERDDGFDYDAARKAVTDYMASVDMKRALLYVEGRCNAYLYVKVG